MTWDDNRVVIGEDEYKLVHSETHLVLYRRIPSVGLLQIAHMETRRSWTVFEQKTWAEEYIRSNQLFEE